MSEYQHYAFRAVDRPLTRQQQKELRDISTRAKITATSFTNTYSWGDLKANPEHLMECYFDAHFYLANWGSRHLIFRFPAKLVPKQVLAPFAIDHESTIKVWSWRDQTLLAVYFNTEDYDQLDDWWEEEDALDELHLLREQIIQGDLRCVYMAWLCFAAELAGEMGVSPDDLGSPPIPAGLDRLDASLKRFAGVFLLDDGLIVAAARLALASAEAADESAELEAFIKRLKPQEKDALLLRVARRARGVDIELLSRFRAEASRRVGQEHSQGVSLGEIMEAALQPRRRHQGEAQSAASAQTKLPPVRIKELWEHWGANWDKVQVAIDKRNRRAYKEAAALMVKLKQVADAYQHALDFAARLRQVRRDHSRRSALMEEMDEAGLS